MTDVQTWLEETEREVGRRRIAAGDARTAIMLRRYDAPIEEVWEACTAPDRIARWLVAVLSVEPRVGGRFELAANASGEILRCEPPRLLVVSWAFLDRPIDEVRLTLSADPDGGTRLELEHATVTGMVTWEGQEIDVIAGVGSGWEPALLALARLLRGEPERATPEERDEVMALIGEIGRRWTA